MSDITPEPKTEDDAQRIKRFLEAGAEVRLTELEAVKAPGQAVATYDRPATLTLPASMDHLLGSISKDAERRVTLELAFGSPTPPVQFSAIIFINKPDASVKTSPEDPAFAGSVGFFVHGGDEMASMPGMSDPLRYQLDITQVIKRLKSGAPSISTTVVLVPLVTPHSFSPGLSILGATLRVVQSTVKRSTT